MAWTAALVALVVVGSLGYMVWAAARRAWNVDGADDRRRERLGRQDEAEEGG